MYIDNNLNDEEAKSLVERNLIDILIMTNQKFESLKEKLKDDLDQNMKVIYYYNTRKGKEYLLIHKTITL